MSDLIPFVIQQEQAEIKKEVNGKCVSVVFDGTTRIGGGTCCCVAHN